MKKKELFITIILVIIVILSMNRYANSKYSLKEIANLIDKSNNVPNNINIKMETIYIEGKKSIYEIYAKDDLIYTHQENKENEEILSIKDELWNYKDKNVITIDYNKKIIYDHEIEGKGKANPVTELFYGNGLIKSTPLKLYKNYGIIKIGKKDFMKFSISSEDGMAKAYYYIDIEDWNVSKIETYINNEIQSNCIFTYNYGTVTDEDILKFDINDYSDYQFINR